MRKKIIKGFILYIFIVICVPVLLYFFVDQCDYGTNNIDKTVWLSFWGTYVGAILGSIATLVSLIVTVQHYREEAKRQQENMQKTHDFEVLKYNREQRRQALLYSRPYLVVGRTNTIDNCRQESIERYVYASEEQDYGDLRRYDEHVLLFFSIKNIGVGPAENINFVYDSAIYQIGGFENRTVHEQMENAPVLFQMMTFDVANGEMVNVSLKLHFSKDMCNSLYRNNQLSFDIRFEDYLHNELQRTVTVDVENKRIVGWDSQKYVDPYNQKLYEFEHEG